MRTVFCGAGIAAIAALAAAAQVPGPTDQDRAAVRQAAYDYAEGYYEGAAERMERAVHPGLIKRGVVSQPAFGPLLTPMNAETLVEVTRAGAAKGVAPDKRSIAFDLLDIRDNVASARIFTVRFNDYLHLVKQEGRWRIAHVLWQPPSPSGAADAEADKTAVAQVVRDVLDALVTGDAARVERLVHPEAAWRTFRVSPPTGKFFLMEGNRDGILAAVRAKAVPPLPNPTVTVLDVYDNIASALTTMPAGSFYWHLARQNNQWRVVNFLKR